MGMARVEHKSKRPRNGFFFFAKEGMDCVGNLMNSDSATILVQVKFLPTKKPFVTRDDEVEYSGEIF